MAYKPYELSEEIKKAQQALEQQLAQKPQDYQSSWEEALKQAAQSLLNRKPFRYDAASDPLYQSYRQQYRKDGRLAMLDTLGQAQANTGGYGNSYAQSAAQQAYGAQLQNLNDKIPELYQMALNRYGLETTALSDRLGYLQQQESQDYSRYQDTLDAWQKQTNLLANQLASQKEQDYDRYVSDRDYSFKLSQADLEQQRWQAEFDEARRQFEANQAAKTATASSKGGGSYAGNQGYDAATVRKAQEFVGTKADGMWGKNSTAAAKAKGYDSLKAVIEAMEDGGSYTITDGVAAVERLAAAGTDEQKLSAYIARLTVEGLLTQSQAASLRKKYVSPRYYY